jgi:hypothetical protein
VISNFVTLCNSTFVVSVLFNGLLLFSLPSVAQAGNVPSIKIIIHLAWVQANRWQQAAQMT